MHITTESDWGPEDTNTEQEDEEDQTKILAIGRLVTRCGGGWGA